MKSRWFNYRPLCFIFAFLLFGSLFAFYVFDYKIITIVVTILVAVLLLVVAILKRKIKYLIVPVVSFFVGVGLYNLAFYNFNKVEVGEAPTTIQARLYRVEKADDSRMRAYADSVLFDNNKIKTNLVIYIYDNKGLYDNIDIGSVLSFTDFKLYKSSLETGDLPNAKYYDENLRYTISVNMNNVNYIKTDKTLAEIIKNRIKENLSNGLSNENVEYSYSSLFGDKDMLDDSLYNNFKLSGIAHLLAVSGLHVGIIVAILNAILSLFKTKPSIRLILVAVFLFVYAFLCNFSVSVVRASIMTIFALLAPLVFREYDNLSALSFAGIILFFVNPLIVFDVSFLLSFACILGIIMLYKPIEAVLIKTKINKSIVDAFSISLATTISLMFIMAYFFNNLNIISLIANVLLIPLFTFAFVIIFVLSLLSLILPFITYLLYPLNYLLNFISLCANLLGHLPIANFATMSIPFISIFIYFVLIYIISRLFTAKKRYKLILSLLTVAILVVTLI